MESLQGQEEHLKDVSLLMDYNDIDLFQILLFLFLQHNLLKKKVRMKERKMGKETTEQKWKEKNEER